MEQLAIIGVFVGFVLLFWILVLSVFDGKPTDKEIDTKAEQDYWEFLERARNKK